MDIYMIGLGGCSIDLVVQLGAMLSLTKVEFKYYEEEKEIIVYVSEDNKTFEIFFLTAGRLGWFPVIKMS